MSWCVPRASRPSARRWPAARPTTCWRNRRQEIAAAVVRGRTKALDRCGVGLEVVRGLLRRHPPAAGGRAGLSRRFHRHGGKGGPHQRGPGLPVSDRGHGPRAGGRTGCCAAEGFAADRTQRATAAAARFLEVAAAYAAAPKVTGLRLYLQTMEIALAGKRKVIVDARRIGGRRALYLGRKGLDLPANLPPAVLDSSPTARNSKEPRTLVASLADTALLRNQNIK